MLAVEWEVPLINAAGEWIFCVSLNGSTIGNHNGLSGWRSGQQKECTASNTVKYLLPSFHIFYVNVVNLLTHLGITMVKLKCNRWTPLPARVHQGPVYWELSHATIAQGNQRHFTPSCICDNRGSSRTSSVTPLPSYQPL